MNVVKRVVLSAVILLTLDFIYLSFNKNAFEMQIVDIQRTVLQLKFLPAILCYIFLVFGLNYFILRGHRSVFDAFLFGLVIYGVYETTNMSLFKKWQWKMVAMDTLWGGVLMGLTTAIIYAI
jgi:uncharacterized membrane protein